MDELGKRIRDFRNLKNLTQSDVADILGINQSSYSRLELKGERTTIEQLRVLAKAFSISEFDLLGYTGGKSDYKSVLDNKEKEINDIQKQLDLNEKERNILKEYNEMLIKKIEELEEHKDILEQLLINFVDKTELLQIKASLEKSNILKNIIEKSKNKK